MIQSCKVEAGRRFKMIKRVETFKNRFETALNLREMKPVDFALRTGISEATISQWRSGRTEPKSERLFMVANALRVDPTWLMGLDVPMDIREQIEQAASPLDHLAIIVNEQLKDRALSRALRVYFTLTDEQKRHILNTIYMFGKANDPDQSSSAASTSGSDVDNNKKV